MGNFTILSLFQILHIGNFPVLFTGKLPIPSVLSKSIYTGKELCKSFPGKDSHVFTFPLLYAQLSLSSYCGCDKLHYTIPPHLLIDSL